MKTFLIKIIFFSSIVTISYLGMVIYLLPSLIEKTEGPSTETQILSSFRNAAQRPYQLLVLGNSGTYRGINPDKLVIPAYNFSHDNDTYNQIYYKFIYAYNKNKNIKQLILGIDYFQFSFIANTRNYVYASLLAPAYQQDYTDNPFDYLLQRYRLLDFDRVKYLTNLLRSGQKSVFLRENGQYIKPGQASENDRYTYSIERIPVQERYFKQILAYCSTHDIEVFLCMLPVRKNAMLNYTEGEIAAFNSFINSHLSQKVHLLDYSHQPGWAVADYTDITHLNEQAADRFSTQLSDTLVALTGYKQP